MFAYFIDCNGASLLHHICVFFRTPAYAFTALVFRHYNIFSPSLTLCFSLHPPSSSSLPGIDETYKITDKIKHIDETYKISERAQTLGSQIGAQAQALDAK